MFFLCARFQKDPGEVHLTAIKCIFRYLIGTSNLGLMFKIRESFRHTSYCDASYVGDKVERKGTSGSHHFIGGKLVTWICKKQGSTTLSTTEVEYMSATSCCAQLLWIKNYLKDYNIHESKIHIFYDNIVDISLSKNTTLHSRTKHMKIKHHFIRSCLK